MKEEYEVINRKSKWNAYGRMQRGEIGTKGEHGQYQRKLYDYTNEIGDLEGVNQSRL